MLLSNKRIIYYDLETTGLNNDDNIIEIAGKDNYDSIFNKLINPECEINDKIVNLTGITNNKIKYRNTIEQNREKIEEWFDFNNKNIYLIAHNGDNFDLKFLKKSFKINCKQIDTLKFFKKLINQHSYSMKNLCNLFGIKIEGHHRALSDVIMLEKLFLKGIELYQIKYNIEEVDIDEIYNYTYNY